MYLLIVYFAILFALLGVLQWRAQTVLTTIAKTRIFAKYLTLLNVSDFCVYFDLNFGFNTMKGFHIKFIDLWKHFCAVSKLRTAYSFTVSIILKKLIFRFFANSVFMALRKFNCWLLIKNRLFCGYSCVCSIWQM